MGLFNTNKKTDKPAESPDQLIRSLDLMPGGYYSIKWDGTPGYSLVRLLDLWPDAIHYVAYSDSFDTLPTADQALAATPAMLHVPQGSGVLYNWQDVTLVASAKLTREDLEGYINYLKDSGDAPVDIEQRVNALIDMSNNPDKAFKINFRVDK